MSDGLGASVLDRLDQRLAPAARALDPHRSDDDPKARRTRTLAVAGPIERAAAWELARQTQTSPLLEDEIATEAAQSLLAAKPTILRALRRLSDAEFAGLISPGRKAGWTGGTREGDLLPAPWIFRLSEIACRHFASILTRKGLDTGAAGEIADAAVQSILIELAAMSGGEGARAAAAFLKSRDLITPAFLLHALCRGAAAAFAAALAEMCGLAPAFVEDVLRRSKDGSAVERLYSWSTLDRAFLPAFTAGWHWTLHAGPPPQDPAGRSRRMAGFIAALEETCIQESDAIAALVLELNELEPFEDEDPPAS